MSAWQKLVGAGLGLGIFVCLLWNRAQYRAELAWLSDQPPMTAAEGKPITIVMLSYAHARRENQLALIGHYGNHPLVDRFLWVWNSPINATKLRAALPRTKAEIMLLEQEQNSLNNRWLIGKHVQTDAILYLDDDDKVLNPMCLHCLYRHWQNDSAPLQGILGHAIFSAKGKIDDYADEHGTYNMVLPNHLLMHRKYLDEYASEQHKLMREYIDNQAAHCDDFFINFMVAHSTKRPHRLLKINYSGTVKSTGLKNQPKRKKLRLDCMRFISNNFDGFIPMQQKSNHLSQCLVPC